ncbi:hypothetical protein [Anabaenopsis elenkinii]|nr:hypothetical protein [Anabaenopsis elenkinii]
MTFLQCDRPLVHNVTEWRSPLLQSTVNRQPSTVNRQEISLGIN